MPLETLEIETAEDPTASIVILHGLGADGRDFESFASELDLAEIGPVRFIFPNSPTRPVTLNGGFVMPAWYDIFGADMVQREDEDGLRISAAQIGAIVVREGERGIAPSRVVLGGFSQGGAMALMTGLRYPYALAGLLCMSGYLPLADKLAAERSRNNLSVPIFQAHGRADPMIDIGRATASRETLLALGYPVEWHDYPMQHSVCAEEIQDIERWLLSVL